MFIRHFYNTQCDGRNGQNILLMNTPDGIRLSPLLDYEFVYVDYENLHRYLWDIGELDIMNPKIINLFRNDSRFQELLYQLMDANINSFISQVKNTFKINIPPEDKKHYIRYESRVKELVLENNLINSKQVNNINLSFYFIILLFTICFYRKSNSYFRTFPYFRTVFYFTLMKANDFF